MPTTDPSAADAFWGLFELQGEHPHIFDFVAEILEENPEASVQEVTDKWVEAKANGGGAHADN